jgi:polysaccharide biosynthesis protein PslG
VVARQQLGADGVTDEPTRAADEDLHGPILRDNQRTPSVPLRIFVSALAALAVGAPAAAAATRPTLVANANFVRGKSVEQRVASYRRLRAAGVEAVRIDFNWVSLEPVGQPLHDYRWRAQDREVRIIRRAGLRILGILAYGHPDYSRAGGEAYARGQKPIPPFGIGDPQYYPPDDPRTFARFAGDVAHRYRRDVWAWEVWNEENGGWRFWEPREDPVAYGRLLCAASASVREADAGAPVVSGGMFFPPFVATGAVRFLDQVLTAGRPRTGGCLDAVGYHPYPYPFTAPEAVVAGRGSVVGAAGQLRRVLRRHGLARKPLWDTEVGWPTNPSGNGVTERRQARYLARLALLSWARDVPVITFYTWGDYRDPSGTNQEAHFGLFRANGSPKPAYRALVTLHRLLGGRGWRFAGERVSPRGVYSLTFRGPGGARLTALWFANERPPAGGNPFARVEPATPARTVAVPLTVGARTSVTTLYGSHPRVVPRAGRVTLRVGQDPLFVRSGP